MYGQRRESGRNAGPESACAPARGRRRPVEVSTAMRWGGVGSVNPGQKWVPEPTSEDPRRGGMLLSGQRLAPGFNLSVQDAMTTVTNMAETTN